MTGIELELISDIKMYLFIEKGMRGDTSYIAKKLVKQIINTCNLMMIKKTSKYIAYLDANNMYGWEMSQYLP